MIGKLANVIFAIAILSLAIFAQDSVSTAEFCVIHDSCNENGVGLAVKKNFQVKIQDDSLFWDMLECNLDIYSISPLNDYELDLPKEFLCDSYGGSFFGPFFCDSDSIRKKVESSLIPSAFQLDSNEKIFCSGTNDLSQFYGKTIKGVNKLQVSHFFGNSRWGGCVGDGCYANFKTGGRAVRSLEYEFNAVIVGECE